jgi:MFS family permease
MDYYNIIKRSWEIVKRQKVLWVFGMVLAVFSGSGGGGFQSGGNFRDLGKLFENKKELPPDTGQKISSVLGNVTSDAGAFFSSIVSQIPPIYWVFLALGIFTLIVLALIIGIFMRNWATGALFALAAEEEKGQELTLKKGSDFGCKYWLRLFLVSFIPWVCLMLVIFGGLLGLALVALILPEGLRVIIFLPMVLGVLVLIVAVLVITVWIAFAQLVVVLEDFPVRETLSFSWKLTKKFFWEGVVLGLINMGFGCLIGCGTMTVIMLAVGLIVIGFLIHKSVGIFLLLCLGTIGLILILGGVLIQGIYKAFTTTNWVLMYLELKRKENFPKD